QCQLWSSVLPTFQATPSDLYTKISGSEILSCECPDHSCQEVFWYRYLKRTNTLQFLVYVNSAGREQHGEHLNVTRFKGSVSSGQRVVYTLRITGLQEDETGLYSCMFKTKNIMPVGYNIMPGVNPPTVQPPTVKTKKPVKICNCKPSNSPKGCEKFVLWPGIGTLLLLAITLAGTLYYFSREYTHSHIHTELAHVFITHWHITVVNEKASQLQNVYSRIHCFRCSVVHCQSFRSATLKVLIVQ
uniref:Cd8 beta n=1 Tax=Sinocyclocheilus grahami TaxID=75366 RepID=A0A672S4T4_SINGR